MTSARGGPPLVLHLVLDLHEGGLERVVVDLMQGIPGDRFRSEVMCLRRRGQLADELRPDQVHLATPDRGPLGMWSPRGLAAAIRARAPDVVHLHSGVWMKGARGARLAGVPAVVFTEHGRPWPDSLSNRLVDHLGSRFTDGVVAVSEPLRQYLIDRVRVDPAKIRIIRNAIPEATPPSEAAVSAARALAGVEPGGLLVGSVGRLDPVKAYDVLIRAIMLLRARWTGSPGPKLVLVGDGPDRPRLESVIAELGAQDAVALVGWQREIRPFLGAMDAFVLSSDSEGTSISLLEAMQAGRAVVVTRVGGNPDVLGPGLVGQQVPPQDPEALAAVLQATLPDPGVRASIGLLGRARVREAFSQAETLSGYCRLYADLLAR